MKAGLVLALVCTVVLPCRLLFTQTQACDQSVLVTVLDQGSSLPIDGLTARDFQVKFRGHDVPIRSVTQSPAQRRFVFVLDRSGSMTGKHEELPIGRYDPEHLSKLTLDDALRAIPRPDSVAFLAFAGESSTQVSFSDPATATAKAQDLLVWSPAGKRNNRTPLWDNIEAALRMLSPARKGDVIIVISDGGDNLSKVRESDLRNELLAAGVPVLAMNLGDPFAATPEEREGAGEFTDLAKDTGGAAILLGQAIRPDPDVVVPVHPGELIRMLSHQYMLDFEVPVFQKPEKWHLALTSSEPSRRILTLYPRALRPCSQTP